MPEVSIANYSQLKSRVEKRIKYSGQFTGDLIGPWLSEIIFDVERTVPLQYSYQTKEFDLTPGENKLALPLLIYGKDHEYEVSIQDNLPDSPPCPIPRLSTLRPGQDRTYTAEERGFPGCFYPISVEDSGRRVPGLLLLPPPNNEAVKLYILGYFHSELSDWTDEATHWLIEEYPELVVAGVCMKANRSLKQNEAADIEEREYLLALLGDNDTGKSGLLQAQRALKLPQKDMMRMQVAPGVPTARNIGDPDYLYSASGDYYYDPYYDYNDGRYRRLT